MKTRLIASLLLTLSVYAAACSGASPKIDERELAQMRKGQTSYDEIVRRFGRPNFASTSWDGSRTAAYAYGEGWSPGALSALGAALGGSSPDTVVLNFDSKGVLVDYKINQAAVKPADAPATPATRYIEPSFGGIVPSPAAKPASASATKPVEAVSATAVPASKPAAVQAGKPERRSDGLPWWMPSSSTREDRY